MEYEGRIWKPGISKDTDQALWVRVNAVGPVSAAESIGRGLFPSQRWEALQCHDSALFELAVPARTKRAKPARTGTFIKIRPAKGGQITARVLSS